MTTKTIGRCKTCAYREYPIFDFEKKKVDCQNKIAHDILRFSPPESFGCIYWKKRNGRLKDTTMTTGEFLNIFGDLRFKRTNR